MQALYHAEAELLDFALSLPEAFEDFPWGGKERTLKVNKKIFAFISIYSYPKNDPPKLRVGVKLTDSHEGALALPFTRVMGYNMGKSGWVLTAFGAGETPPLPLLIDWVEESYRNIAPKRLLAELEDGINPPPH